MAESGTCNVCAAPCTSCMHFNRLVPGVKTETISGEGFCDNASSQHSANKSAIVNPLKKHAFDNLHDTASATSSYKSLSENNKNNETVMANVSGDIGNKKSVKDRKESNISCLGGTKLDLRELGCAKTDKGSSVVSDSDVLVKPTINAALKTEGDNNYISEESLDVVSASRGTSDDPEELTDVTEPSSESHSVDESEEVVEQDVNICDICGDAGREDLLATCSGCSDGAEHTYCMQEKMDKVPEGEWFCEECRLAEKSQKQHDYFDEVGKVEPISRLRSLSLNLSLKLDSKESSVVGNSSEVYTPGTQSRKRQLERVESSTGPKRQATEISKDLSVASSPRRLLRDGSFKSGSREKVNKLYQPSHGMNNVSSHSQSHKGPLLKSNSFNAVSLKSKGKSADDIPYKQKTHREHTESLDVASRLMARSMSLRPAHLGRPNAGEPKTILLSPKSSHAPEMKGFKKSKDHQSHDRKKLIRDERASSMARSLSSSLDTNRKTITSDNGFVSTDTGTRDSRASQSDEKIAPLSKLTAHAMCHALDMPERKKNKPHGKEESTSRTWTASKHISSVDANLNSELLQAQDASYQAVKNTDTNLTQTRLGKSISGSNLSLQCKEPITAAHLCMTSSPRLSASDSATVKIPADDIEKMNPLKAALHAAFLKKSIISKKRRAPDNDQFDEQPITPTSNGQNSSHDVWPGSSYSKSSLENKHTSKLPLNNVTYATGQESSVDYYSRSSLLSKKMMIQVDVGGDGKSIGNVLPIHSVAHICTAPTTAIPVHEYIWQGDFEVNRNGKKVVDTHPGFQAHLSTFASPKVMEVVRKLSPKLSLTETPRLSSWPTQFHEIGATEDNIALYFFAKDIESYERHYKVLLDNMMRNDLALKGDSNGVEILIFPSSQLPHKSQRWNMLFFMWGVFRAKKRNCHSQMDSLSSILDASGKPCILESDASPSIPGSPRTAASTDLKKPDCELIRDAISGRSSGNAQSLLKGSPADLPEEEHVVDMECEVQPNLKLDGATAVTSRPALPGNECTSALKSSTRGVQSQELHFAGPERVNYCGNEEKDVGRVMIEGKVNEDDGDVKPSLKDPSMRDAEDFDSGQSSKCHGDLGKVSCRDSNIDISNDNAQAANPRSKDVKFCCSTSDAHETGPSISSKKIMYDLNLDAIDIMEESDTVEGFLPAVESAQAINFQGTNSSGWDLNSSANDIQVDNDTETFPSSNSSPLPLFVEMVEHIDSGAENKEESPAASLSLSLALPFMEDKHQSSKHSTQGKPPFLLFGKLADKQRK